MLISVGIGCIYKVIKEMTYLQKIEEKKKFEIMRQIWLKM